MFVGFLLLSKDCNKIYCNFTFGLEELLNRSPYLLLEGKQKEKGTVQHLERHNRDLFPLSLFCVPFNFFIPQAELRQPQIKAVHAVSHMMIKFYLGQGRWTDNGSCRKPFVLSKKTTVTKNAVPSLCCKTKLNQTILGPLQVGIPFTV